MKTRTICLILDLSTRFPAKNGKSRLQCGIESLIEVCNKMEVGDKALLRQKDSICVYKTGGESKSALLAYKPNNLKFVSVLAEMINAALSLGQDDIYIFAMTDRYEEWMDFDCNFMLTQGMMKATGRKFNVYMWSVGKTQMTIECPGINASLLSDISGFIVNEDFSGEKAECHLDIMPDCSPLVF